MERKADAFSMIVGRASNSLEEGSEKIEELRSKDKPNSSRTCQFCEVEAHSLKDCRKWDIRDEEEDDRLTELVAIEKVGTEEDEKLKPLEDDVAIDISDENTKRSKGGENRETGLLLHDFESVPESRTAAKRLRTLERKMDRGFADANGAMLDKGNARVLSPKGAERVMETIPAELSAKVQGENMTDPCFAYSVKPYPEKDVPKLGITWKELQDVGKH
ncbi:hypothetical protein GE061_009196 [Apolygus lucorum]|uniref:Uncharacterized protein n=1 Tax=Apolygus lucorum TaxID=248454 RepID=A0A8S9XZV8_APOLU|nr:hypothetical protein GE061_009196 [Apolygus lucorum]